MGHRRELARVGEIIRLLALHPSAGLSADGQMTDELLKRWRV